MPTSVVMPQMGESIAEGTIVRWNKNVGDTVDRDEPLFEIATDKVDAEIPSPVAGVLLKITAREGETVPVDSVVALIGAPGETIDDAPVAVPEPTVQTGPDGSAAQPVRDADPYYPPRDPAEAPAEATFVASGRRLRSSPLVRRIAKDQGVDVSVVPGSGSAGRVTKRDILAFIDRRASGAGARQPFGAPAQRVPPYQPGEPVEVKPLSVVRRKIAEHMVLSRRTSAHVHTVFHVDFSAVEAARAARRAEFERAGMKLTPMAFIAQACAKALRAHPLLNAALDGDTIVYKKDINLGVAVAIEGGLIVPVVRYADTLDLAGLSAAIADVAARARAKQLKPEEVHGGTFTITNPGQLGAQFGMPIINQPQVAILGVGAIERRAVVVDDAVVARPMAYLTLGFDHRLIDGFAADQFMAEIKRTLESA
jgi:2-oxoglutarate dehydrogenase E2 component (dihydrolipoamide succinyltransferase)